MLFRSWNQFGDLQEEIGGALVPVLKDMMEQLRPILQALADWIEKNPEATTSVLEWAGAIGAVSIALKALMPVFTLVRGGFMLIVDAVVAVAAALELPVIAVVAVVAAIGAAAYAIITNWDAVKAFFEDFWQSLQGIFEIGARNVGELVGWLAQNIVQEFTDPVTFLEELWAGLVDFFSAVWGQIKAVFDWAVTNVFDPVIEKAKEDRKSTRLNSSHT